jgi:superfamily II RNA helicase
VVTTVTKRINSEVVKLKTSQLLQMAGRAGRRGKDTEGTVVVMRNRFEDVKMSHKILTTAVDGIKSHFKTSYGLCVKLLETKSLDDCRALIERGFGAYLMQQRVVKKQVAQVSSEAENYRSLLQKYTLVGAREYLKLVRRFDKEKKNYDFILSKMMKSENELVQAIVEYMPAGIGVQLKDESSAFFLGEVNWRTNLKFVGYAVIKPDGQIMKPKGKIRTPYGKILKPSRKTWVKHLGEQAKTLLENNGKTLGDNPKTLGKNSLEA